MGRIEAVTFDLWDTLVRDDSDEPVRAGRGLPPKPEARARLLVDELRVHHPELTEVAVRAAHDVATATFRRWWKVEHRTPGVAERLDVALAELGVGRTPGFDAMVAAYEAMEVEIPPEIAPGALACLDALRGRYKLAILSDAIVTPGRGLRQILAQHGMRDHFDAFVFSDEVGASKPAPHVFHEAARRLGVAVEGLVHIGDREANDIVGPLGVGAGGVLYTGVVDRGSSDTRAHAVCRHHDDLPSILQRLES